MIEMKIKMKMESLCRKTLVQVSNASLSIDGQAEIFNQTRDNDESRDHRSKERSHIIADIMH